MVIALSMVSISHAQTTIACSEFIKLSNTTTCGNCDQLYLGKGEIYCSECTGVFSSPNKKNFINATGPPPATVGDYGCSFSFGKSW